MSDHRTSRRQFLRRGGAVIAGGAAAGLLADQAAAAGRLHTLALPEREPESYSSQDTIRLATIGVGIQGSGDTATALRVPGVELVAAADVYDGRLVRARRGGTVTYVDSKRIIVDNADEYELRKFVGLNERTCLNQRSLDHRDNRCHLAASCELWHDSTVGSVQIDL